MLNLNLLDHDRRARLTELARVRAMIGLVSILFGILLVVSGGLIGINFLLQNHYRGQQTELLTVKTTTRGGALSLTETTLRFNQELATLKPIVVDPMLDQLLIALAEAIPSSVHLTSLSIATSKTELTFTGIAQTRNDIPALEKNLKALLALNSVTLDSNLNERTNVTVAGHATFDPTKLHNQ
ncbi:MAG: PilN domain-containing protein [Candidatus Kerfeldbacteria bacterium]|nr:PilN domain-containing protein [Candidatus Kerfeldbacteria bacterium]